MSGLPGSLIWRGMIWRHLTFSDLSHIRCHTGAYFRFRYDFTDPHEFACLSPFTIYALRWWRGHYFMTILQLSLFRAIQPDLLYIWCHTGAYFHFGGGLEISIELHDHSHLRSTCRDYDLFDIDMMIPQWSLSGVIQLGTHFSALRYHRAPLSDKCILAWWVWCCYGFGWPRLHIYQCMTWCHSIFLACYTFDAILGHIFHFYWDF